MPEQVNEPVNPNVNGEEVLSADSAPADVDKVKKSDVIKPNAVAVSTPSDDAPKSGVDTFGIIPAVKFGADATHALAQAQGAADDAVRLENPTKYVAREANPDVGGESIVPA